MASTILPFTSSSALSLATNQTQHNSRLASSVQCPWILPCLLVRTRGTQKVLSELGDYGARDPFPAEIASNFGEKVLGNFDTEHKILIPDSSALSLSQQELSSEQCALSLYDAKRLLLKVIGWKLLEEESGLKLHCVWKLRDSECAEELLNRIYGVVGGQSPYFRLEEPNQVIAELWTPSIGGLTINDFILAAKIDKIKISDLTPRRRAWA